MVVTKGEARVIADGVTFSAGQSETGDASDMHTPAVCVSVDNLGALTDDTVTVEIVGKAGAYEVDSRTVSSAGSYIVDCPQAPTVRVTSGNGSTITAEVRNNPR